MGEVYRAHDTKLKRDVAIKVIPLASVNDPERLARFQREARLLASLNHPNIATIYGLEDSESTHALVMELVEGPTLADRIRRGPIPVEEALPIARQMAEALEYAHEHGIVHRDLKPANVKVAPDDTVKILDFGLAKALAGDAASADIANSPTISQMATETGVLLGTAAYMSPEQAKGKPVDRRADIWAFGCVLYEMLTGKKAFDGETMTDTLAAIMRAEPDWSLLPVSTPPHIRALLKRCLQKEPKQRLRDIGDARITVEEVLSGAPEGTVAGIPLAAVPKWRRALPWVAGVLIGAGVASLIAWRVIRSPAPATWPQGLTEQRLTGNPPEDPMQAAAISPDGKVLAYSDQNGTHLRLIKTGDTRDLFSARQLIVSSISWLPDGSGIMVTGSQHGEPAGIWAISVLGGTPRKLRDNAVQPAISPDGARVAFLAGLHSGLASEIWVMNASGEEARRVLTAQPVHAFQRLGWSPDGHRIMYLNLYFASAGPEEVIESMDLKGGDVAPVVSSPALVHDFCWLPDGRVLYSQGLWSAFGSDSNLWEISVDTQTGKTKGVPTKVANGPGFAFSGLSRTADGKQLVFVKQSSQSDVSVGDLNSQGTSLTTPRRLTYNESFDWPVGWTPDGKAVVFWSVRSGQSGFYKKNLIGGEAVPLFPGPEPVWYGRYSPGGSWFLYMALPKPEEPPGPTVPMNIMRVAVSGGTPQLVLRARGMTNLRCARSPATVCVYDEADQGTQTFFEFDPIGGKGREVARSPRPLGGSSWWDLSPDGSRLAVIDSAEGQGRIKLLPLGGGQSSELAVKGWSGLREMDWSPDGKALYVSSLMPQHAAVLRVDLKGRARVLWEGNPIPDTCGRPSPDGRHLAIAVYTTQSNAWIMKNF
jgi:Tol biopolymer transport system component